MPSPCSSRLTTPRRERISLPTIAEGAQDLVPSVICSKDASSVSQRDSDSLFTQGEALFKEGKYAEALHCYNRAISMGDQRWQTQNARAAAMIHLGGVLRRKAVVLLLALCKEYGDRFHQPWLTLATAHLAVRLPLEAEKSIVRGLEVADAPAREEFLALRQEAMALPGVKGLPGRRARFYAKANVLPGDILILIAEVGVEDDYRIGFRMARVCRSWRRAMLSSSLGWTHLDLTEVPSLRPSSAIAKRCEPEVRAQHWIDRSRGRITRLTLPSDFPYGVKRRVAKVLTGCVGEVKHLTLPVCFQSKEYYEPDYRFYRERKLGRYERQYWEWRGLLRVKALRSSCRRVECFVDDVMLLAPQAGLEVIDYGRQTKTPLRGLDEDTRPSGQFIPSDVDFAVRIANLKILRIPCGFVDNPRWLRNLAAAAPMLRELAVGCRTLEMDHDRETKMVFEHVTHLELCDGLGYDVPFKVASFPALVHLSCWNSDWRFIREWTHSFGAPGIPLSQLESLDMGMNGHFLQSSLLAILRQCDNLRFLNLSSCRLTDSFIDALVAGENTLLPNLVALSLASNESLTAGPLRRMVESRMSRGKTVSENTGPSPAKRFAYSSAHLASRSPPQPPAAAAGATAVGEPEVDRVPAKGGTEVAQLQWLNVDMCTNLHKDASAHELGWEMRFFSASKSRDYDRIRGRKQYAWGEAVKNDWIESPRKRKAVGGYARDLFP